MIKFNKFAVVDTATKIKARVWYALDNRIDGRKCVTIYARDYTGELGRILNGAYENQTDMQVDYFDKGKAVLFTDHPLYAEARKTAQIRQDILRAKSMPVTIGQRCELPGLIDFINS